MARYIKQDLFDAGAAAVARANYHEEQDMAAVAAYLAREYQRSYADSDLQQKWMTAATEALSVCENLEMADDLVDYVLACYPHYALHFDNNGGKKPFWKNLGTWFSYERAPIQDLPGRFTKRFLAYAFRGKLGRLPPEWIPPEMRG